MWYRPHHAATTSRAMAGAPLRSTRAASQRHALHAAHCVLRDGSSAHPCVFHTARMDRHLYAYPVMSVAVADTHRCIAASLQGVACRAFLAARTRCCARSSRRFRCRTTARCCRAATALSIGRASSRTQTRERAHMHTHAQRHARTHARRSGWISRGACSCAAEVLKRRSVTLMAFSQATRPDQTR